MFTPKTGSGTENTDSAVKFVKCIVSEISELGEYWSSLVD